MLEKHGSSRSTLSSRLARLARLARQSRTCRVESSRVESSQVEFEPNFLIPDGTELPCCKAGAELNITMEEAAARIVPHMMHAVTHGISRIIVLSADTDVFVLMVFYWNVLSSQGLSELWVKAGVGDSTRFIPIHVLAAQIGENFCQVLPVVHVLTGCDYTSKIGTKHAAADDKPRALPGGLWHQDR